MSNKRVQYRAGLVSWYDVRQSTAEPIESVYNNSIVRGPSRLGDVRRTSARLNGNIEREAKREHRERVLPKPGDIQQKNTRLDENLTTSDNRVTVSHLYQQLTVRYSPSKLNDVRWNSASLNGSKEISSKLCDVQQKSTEQEVFLRPPTAEPIVSAYGTSTTTQSTTTVPFTA